MTSAGEKHSVNDELYVGNRCMLRVAGEHFLVGILEVQKAHIRVTFPGREYPIEGLQVTVEFHDELGFNSYRTHVVRGPETAGGGLILARPVESRRTQYRDSCRVPTDLTVQVKDQVHVRRYDAALVNLSAGGALIVTPAQFDFSTTVEMQLSLPGEPRYTLIGQVVHATGAPTRYNITDKTYGVRFVSLEPDAARSITRYVWARLREIFPSA
ncbi:MAG: PilZ domain-containing protein [Candidatus Hydrogenedentes bacterium]|nr:PilZ domain-containing protein [Candidatus Hydrogenedentota bacterium]